MAGRPRILKMTIVDPGDIEPTRSKHPHSDIENLWMRAKRKLKRQFGTNRANFPSYLWEFEFRCSVIDRNFFGAFLVLISENCVL